MCVVCVHSESAVLACYAQMYMVCLCAVFKVTCTCNFICGASPPT